jgi:hypothetical protein
MFHESESLPAKGFQEGLTKRKHSFYGKLDTIQVMVAQRCLIVANIA